MSEENGVEAVRRLEMYDTTLRDGAQRMDISFTVDDKLAVTTVLDKLGVDFIEGGWPGANPKDVEYFERVRSLKLLHAKIVAFGSTHNPKNTAEEDENLKALVVSGTEIVTIFGKTWDFHVKKALKIALKKNLKIIRDSIRFCEKMVSRYFLMPNIFLMATRIIRNTPCSALRRQSLLARRGLFCVIPMEAVCLLKLLILFRLFKVGFLFRLVFMHITIPVVRWRIR